MNAEDAHAFAAVDVETDDDGHQLVPTRARIVCRCGWVTCDGNYAPAADVLEAIARHLQERHDD